MEMRVQILPKEKERYKKLFRIVFERDPTQEEIKNYMSTTDQRLKEVTQKGYERSVRKKINEWRPSSSKDVPRKNRINKILKKLYEICPNYYRHKSHNIFCRVVELKIQR